jgi:hypothetical protein
MSMSLLSKLTQSNGVKRAIAIAILVLSQFPQLAPVVALLNQLTSLVGLNPVQFAAALGAVGVAHAALAPKG